MWLTISVIYFYYIMKGRKGNYFLYFHTDVWEHVDLFLYVHTGMSKITVVNVVPVCIHMM